MKVAIASSDGIHVNDHFGWAKQFALYEVDEKGFAFVRMIACLNEVEEESKKLAYRIDAIKEADILYCSQIGPTASKMVLAARIHPIRSSGVETIDEALDVLVRMITTNPPIWLLRIINKGA
jgi:nitrogen fixation protein NifX